MEIPDSLETITNEQVLEFYKHRKRIRNSFEAHSLTISDLKLMNLEVPSDFIRYHEKESLLLNELEKANTIWKGVPIFISDYQSCSERLFYVRGIGKNSRYAEIWGYSSGDHILKFWENMIPRWTADPVKKRKGDKELNVYGVSSYNFQKLRHILYDFVATGKIHRYVPNCDDRPRNK